jgi:hypothetical protein
MDLARLLASSPATADGSPLPALALLGAALALPAISLLPAARRHRANLVLAAVTAAAVYFLVRAPAVSRWIALLVLVPPFLVLQQATFLWNHRPRRRRGEILAERPPGVDEARYNAMVGGWEDNAQSLLGAIQSHYSPQTLFVRYGLPAVLLAATGLVVVVALVEPTHALFGAIDAAHRGDEAVRGLLLRGARYGAAGAYVFVMLDLGRRAFRHDITSGSATWAVVTLIVGPLLAATIALVWRLPADEASWQSGLVLFFAGMAPRRIMTIVEQSALNLLKASPAAGPPSRVTPLNQIRGITAAHAERLAEEGVTDTIALAYADPIRLVRNTSYDLRQILAWIDEAILITYLPAHWQKLEEAGITGAIDLAWVEMSQDKDQQVQQLAEHAGIRPALLLAGVVNRLFYDEHVRRVWALYNAFTDEGRDDENHGGQVGA